MISRHHFKIILFVLVLSVVFLLTPTFNVQAQIGGVRSNVAQNQTQSTPMPTVQNMPPSAPQINVAPEIYYPLDETLYIEGKADPKSRVELFFEKPDSNPVHQNVDANSSGEWFFSQKLELASGEWTVKARVSHDPPSDWSTPRIIQSRITGFIIGSVRIKYAPVAAVLALLFLLGGGLLVYSILRVRTVRRGAHERELQEGMEKLQKELRVKEREATEVLLEQHFSEIRGGVLKELEHLEVKAADGAALSSDEEAHRAKLLRELREAEESIQKKLREI